MSPIATMPWGDGVSLDVGGRALGAFAGALAMTLVAGRILIPWLRRREILEQVQKTDSAVLAERHSAKAGTPTMGGLVFVPPMLLGTLVFADLAVAYVPITLAVVGALALLGWRDDHVKLHSRRRHGLAKRRKFRTQLAISFAAAIAIWWLALGRAPESMRVAIPFVEGWTVDLAWWGGLPFVCFAAFVLTGTSNAVNLADGLDGLAAGCSLFAFIPFAVLAYVAGRADLAGGLGTPFVPGAGEMAVFAAAALGSCVGFLWFNCYPARVFMGDTGALALGGALGMTALAVRQELLLVLVGGIFVLETVSVILQVFSFQVFGKRIFRIAPIHHHFQFGGLPEWTVTTRFWLAGAGLAILSLFTLPWQ